VLAVVPLLALSLFGASSAAAVTTSGAQEATAAAAAVSVDRLSGSDRYATSAAISAASFPAGVAVAYIATGANFPDALAGAAVAGRDRAPLLTVRPTAIPSAVATELRRLAPKRIVVLGGTGAVSDAVLTALRGYTTGAVSRVSGADRYAVAAALSRTSYSSGAANVYVATGTAFADALSGAAAAGAKGSPLLLVNSSVPSSTRTELQRLKPAKITVLGGTGAVPDSVVTTLKGITSDVVRISGADRFATSAAVSKSAFGSASRALVATGLDFPDALSGAPVAAGAPGPVLLTRSNCVPKTVNDELTRLAATRMTLLGGTSVLGAGVANRSVCVDTPGSVCTKPTQTLARDDGWDTQGYYVHNNMWNSSLRLGPETIYACSYRSWYVTSNQAYQDGGAVLTYPNVHKDYTDWAGYAGPRISSFGTLTSRFAAKSPHVGVYNVAYDIWLNGVADTNSTEVMIWTDNYKQTPAGSKVTSVAFNGMTYDVWKESDNKYIAFVPRSVMPSGTLNLLAMLKWLQGKGWVSSTSTIGQICFGVEIVSTGGTTARWDVTDFNISSS
jgi:putative cell wall-binding protein